MSVLKRALAAMGAVSAAATLTAGLVGMAPAPAEIASGPAAEVTSIVPMATSVAVGGGLWQYGRDGAPFGTSWSNYHHATKYHSATACNGALFQTCKQVTAAKNVWAKASTAASLSGNTAYWNTY